MTVPLARALMRRIGNIVPVLPVPAVSWLILHKGPMTRAELSAALSEIVRELPEIHVHLPHHEVASAVEVGAQHLLKRKMLIEENGRLSPAPGETELLRYYSNSIRHLMPDAPAGAPAGAGEVSALAGS